MIMREKLDKRFVKKKVNMNGKVTDVIMPKKALSEWKDLIVE